jgi:hypothetical protein
MALGRKIVDLVRLYLLDDTDDVRRVRHVSVMENEVERCLVRIW